MCPLLLTSRTYGEDVEVSEATADADIERGGRTDVGQRTTSHLGRDARTRVRNFKTDVSCCVGIVLRTGLVCVWRIMSNEDERRMARNVDVDVDVNVDVNGTGTRYVQMRVRAGRTIIRRVRGVGR